MDKAGTPADSSALIYLAKAGGLLPASTRLGPLLSPPAVWKEVVEIGERRGSSEVGAIRAGVEAGFIRRATLDVRSSERAIRIAREFGLGAGESEVLALGDRHSLVLLDDRRAARAAGVLGIITIQVLGVPVLCAQAGTLGRDAVLELLDAVARHTTVPSELLTRTRALILEASP